MRKQEQSIKIDPLSFLQTCYSMIQLRGNRKLTNKSLSHKLLIYVVVSLGGGGVEGHIPLHNLRAGTQEPFKPEQSKHKSNSKSNIKSERPFTILDPPTPQVN